MNAGGYPVMDYRFIQGGEGGGGGKCSQLSRWGETRGSCRVDRLVVHV